MNIFLLAGEVSGDVLGGKLMASLKKQSAGNLSMAGIGGANMAAQGLDVLLPMEELNVMGISEVLFQLPRLIKLLNGIAEEIETRKPDILITIDFPDFNFRLAQRLKKRGIFKGKIVHYVAPTVWAWRPKRAQKIAKFLDGLLCLYPFEPEYFTAHGLPAEFVGHPIVEEEPEQSDPLSFRASCGMIGGEATLGVFFGSRHGELKRLSKVIVETAEYVAENVDNLHLIVPTLPHLEMDVRNILDGCGVPYHVTTTPSEKWSAFRACGVAIAVSGTVGLELSYAGVPHIIGYKTSALNYAIAKMLVKTKYAHLGNILMQEPIVPEFIQGACKSEAMAAELIDLLEDSAAQTAQRLAFQKLRTRLHNPERSSPSDKAAAFILG